MTIWDEALEAQIRAEFATSDDQELIEQALEAKSLTARGRAGYELSRRALDNPALLTPALAAIDRDHVRLPKSFPPLGWLAAARILGSENPAATAPLLQAMSAWDGNDQRGLLEWCLPRGERSAWLRRFESAYGWKPGAEIAN